MTGITYQRVDIDMNHASTCVLAFLFPVRVDAGRRGSPAHPSVRGGQDAGGCGRIDGRNTLADHLEGRQGGGSWEKDKRGLDLPYTHYS